MDIDLDGLMVTDEAAKHLLFWSLLIPAGGYIVFGISADTTNGGVAVDYEYTDMSLVIVQTN